ncbi:hypothetical protein N007_06270 [Alicyclobacillus acidoterrestris ATCC 49025]|nr:hypothetical protein N007_06270 [Alicyclobacillus acidoterrestris ATCC 49025]
MTISAGKWSIATVIFGMLKQDTELAQKQPFAIRDAPMHDVRMDVKPFINK